jgi:ubiquinone/menaquinone biosynthesis C-methylase UbiE
MLDLPASLREWPLGHDRGLGGITQVLPRVLESEVMDKPEEARDYDAMDHSAVNLRFVEDFLSAHGPGRGGEMLDVGTGPARVPIALCRADRYFRVLGVDLAGPMLELARRNVAEAELSDRIRFARGDAKNLPFPDGRFEAVVSNTIIHHIPDPAPALAEMVRLVAPGGTLMVRDLARPVSEAELDALVEKHAANEPIPSRNLFRDSLHASLTLSEVQEIVQGLGLSQDCVRMTSDRHWTWIWSRPT